jgi:Transglutaminase-like superfamily
VSRRRISRLLLAAEAAVMLTVASVRLRWRPQSETTSLLGNAEPAAPHPAPPLSGASIEAIRIGRAVERVATVLPWHPVCLPRAVAAATMLRRRRIECRAHLGVTSDRPPEAHAWVTVGGVVVQGAPLDGVTELASFA